MAVIRQPNHAMRLRGAKSYFTSFTVYTRSALARRGEERDAGGLTVRDRVMYGFLTHLQDTSHVMIPKSSHTCHTYPHYRLQNFPLKTELNGNDVAIAHVQ